MVFLRPLSRRVTRPAIAAILLAWTATMAALVNRSYLQAAPVGLATDLARYGSEATWRGVYYRGEKIGFTVSQTVPEGDGFRIEEDGRLQMSLLGATTAAAIRTAARVDREFAVRSFEFTLDPGTGPIRIQGEFHGARLTLSITTPSGSRTETRELPEPPALTLNLARRLASQGLTRGARHRFLLFDPATLRNAPVIVEVGDRELVGTGVSRVPAFRVRMDFSGLRTTSWVTDTGEVIREESPMGLMTIREPAERARGLAIPDRVNADLLRASAIVPDFAPGVSRIDETRDVRRLRLRLAGVPLDRTDLNGVGQVVDGEALEITALLETTRADADAGAGRYLGPEPLIESDAPEIRDETRRALSGANGDRLKAERLTRYVNGLLDKKPTVSLPSAREVLRTRVGDCNEHTALYVAMARAAGLPARIAAGLVYVRGAFYYHAWPEVYLRDGARAAGWLPVDPTLNQFPADATHVRLARGGLDRQAAILPLIGRLRVTVTGVELTPGATRALAGRERASDALELPFAQAPPRRRCR
jgi:transglutaminase-like putative cysteine protease